MDNAPDLLLLFAVGFAFVSGGALARRLRGRADGRYGQTPRTAR